jgi:hypothetical protein
MELIQTCYRITDPERAIASYEALGLETRAKAARAFAPSAIRTVTSEQ